MGPRLGLRQVVGPAAHRLAAAVGARAEPSFLILGAQKAGTTALYEFVTGHPDVRKARRKEIHYFDRYRDRGWQWYCRQLPLAAARNGVMTGEATPYYLFHPDIPTRVAASLPDIRLIVLLRNPTERAYSHYQHSTRHDVGPDGFAHALDIERDVRSRYGDRPDFYDQDAWHRHSYVARGYYADQLERWFECFPREQFLIMRSEELLARPAEQVLRALAFLGLSGWSPPAYPEHHRGGYRVDPNDRVAADALREHYRPHNRRLGRLLDRDFSGWDSAAS